MLLVSAFFTQAQDLLIENVNVVDVRSGRIIPGQNVLVQDGRIADISVSAGSEFSGDRLDGENKYLMPGLAEMHAHIPSPDWGRRDTEATLFLYLSNGITTIRGMLGHPAHLELRRKVKMGQVMSPRIFTASPSLNGNTVPTKEEARKKVTAYKEAGYDFLKIHPGIKLECRMYFPFH